MAFVTLNEKQKSVSGNAKSENRLPYRIKEIREVNGYDAIRMMARMKIASNTFVEPFYQSGELGRALWTEPIIIYAAPSQAFGSRVEFENASFNVPREFQELKSAALCLPSMSFKLSDRGGRLLITVSRGKKIIVVENFPPSNGFYIPDAKTGMPQGAEALSENASAIYLWRRKEGQYIGPVVRGYRGGIVAIYGLDNYYRVALLGHDDKAQSGFLKHLRGR